MRLLLRGLDFVTDAMAKLAALLLGVVVVLFWIEVGTRYLLVQPTNVSTSIPKYLVMVAIMSILPWLTREGHHVAMTFIYEHTPKRFSRMIGVVIAMLSSMVCLLSAWMGSTETYRHIVQSITTDDEVIFPMWWASIFVVYGFLGAALHFLRQALTGAVVQRSDV